jgi:hypothetical protein
MGCGFCALASLLSRAPPELRAHPVLFSRPEFILVDACPVRAAHASMTQPCVDHDTWYPFLTLIGTNSLRYDILYV